MLCSFHLVQIYNLRPIATRSSRQAERAQYKGSTRADPGRVFQSKQRKRDISTSRPRKRPESPGDAIQEEDTHEIATATVCRSREELSVVHSGCGPTWLGWDRMAGLVGGTEILRVRTLHNTRLPETRSQISTIRRAKPEAARFPKSPIAVLQTSQCRHLIFQKFVWTMV
jgi:hypothetical protein